MKNKNVLKKGVENTSIWAATARMPSYPSLKKNIHAQVCIIGGGIAGLTTAYLLTQAGKSVVLLEDGELAGGMTQYTTGHLSNAIDDRYYNLERMHGIEKTRLAWQSHTDAIDKIESIIKKEKISCDFERLDGFLFLGRDQEEKVLDAELKAAHAIGFRGVEKLPSTPFAFFKSGPSLRFPSQAQFHVLKYLSKIAEAVVREGGQIYCKTHADDIKRGEPAQITAGKFSVTADALVIATNNPINDLVAIHTKQPAYMTYVIAAKAPRHSLKKGLYWDTEDPYHYIRTQRISKSDDQVMLIIGGEDHKSGQEENTHKRYVRLEQWARERFPEMGAVEFRWSGQVMESIDGIGFIGKNPLDKDNVFVITGDSGLGLTNGTIGGMLLTDLIMGKKNRFQELYDPSRKTIRAIGEYAKETANMASQYVDWLTPGDVDSVSKIENDSGAVIRRGLMKVAVYRDEKGKLHERSAVCTHLGCIVDWNSGAKSWDCPCHGSRYDKFGKVIVGPANKDLAMTKDQGTSVSEQETNKEKANA